MSQAPLIHGAVGANKGNPPAAAAPVLNPQALSVARNIGAKAATVLSYAVPFTSKVCFGTMGLAGRTLSYAGTYLNPPVAAKKPAAPGANGQQAPAETVHPVSRLVGTTLQRSGSAISYVADKGPAYMNGKTAAAVAGAYVASGIMPAAISSVASSAIRYTAESLLAPVAYAPAVVTTMTGIVFSAPLNGLLSLALKPLEYVPTLAGNLVSIVPAEVLVGGVLGYTAVTSGYAAKAYNAAAGYAAKLFS